MRSPKAPMGAGMRERVRQRPRMRDRRLSHLSVNRMVPNVLTLLALCAGMTAIRFAISGDFQYAVFAIIAAGIFDGLDGRLARLLKATSQFGAELDSLADFISFGVAPAAVLYLWTMAQLHSVGWAIVLFYAVCCALRLARFNTQLAAEPPPWAANFFSGAPAPAGAGLLMLPMFISFEWGDLDRALAVSQCGVDQRHRADDGQHGADGVVEAHPDPASFRDPDAARDRRCDRVLDVRAVADPDRCRGGLSGLDPVDDSRLPRRRAAPSKRASREPPRRRPPLPTPASLPLGETTPPASEWRH